MLKGNKLNDEALNNVSGGAGMAADSHEEDFKKAWIKLNMDSMEISQMSQAEYLDEWKHLGYPNAEEFLKTKIS